MKHNSILKEGLQFLEDTVKYILEKEDKDSDQDNDADANIGDDGNRADPPPTLKKSKEDNKEKGNTNISNKKSDVSIRKKSDSKKGKVSKETASYVETSEDPNKRCGNCKHFSSPKSCAKVEGEINTDGLSSLYQKQEKEESIIGDLSAIISEME
jgi:hypothetical protein